MIESQYIVFFPEAKPNTALLGGKGSNLIKLIKMKANVPPGFIINTNSFKKFLNESKYYDQLSKLLAKTLNVKEILHHSAKITKLILESKIPKKIIESIEGAFDKLVKGKDEDLSFAVRSSATIEDSSKFSFAGQTESYLYNLTFHDLLQSLKNCWASLFSPRAILYMLHMKKLGVNFSLKNIHMAVIVQKMVNSQISGVLFTSNVVNSDSNQMLINSTWGLGNMIADSLVIPDSIIIKKNKFEVLKSIIGKKKRKSIKNPEGAHTIIVETYPKS
ncbi:unnamed protein product, partial [marine sediment metagenome]